MKKLPVWRSSLTAFIYKSSSKPFLLGDHDCALFAASAVHAMSGEDIGAPYRGKYTTLLSGLRILRREGYDNHAERMADLLQEVPGGPAFGQVGDIAAIPSDDESFYVLGVVQGPRVYVTRPGAAGLGTVDLMIATRIFRVPE